MKIAGRITRQATIASWWLMLKAWMQEINRRVMKKFRIKSMWDNWKWSRKG